MKTNIAISALFLTFGFNAFAAPSTASSTGAVFSRQTVEGIEAQFILEALADLKSIRGLEGIGECDLDLCTFEVRSVKCIKEAGEPAGSLEEPSVGIGCWIAPSNSGSTAVHVLHEDSAAVSKLRRAMIDKTRRLQHTTDSNTVTVDSISCTGTGIGRHELDSLRIEPVYKCELQYP